MSKTLTMAEISWAGRSETGPIREDNQDSILLPDHALDGFFASLAGLADGMGGYASGDIASSLALSSFRQVILDARGSLPAEKMLRRAVETANLAVYKIARELGLGRMGTTLTIAYLAGNILSLAHVGDSRAYLVRNGNALCLTNDHTLVGDLVRSHLITPDKVRHHEQRSILTRAVGIELFLTPEITQHKLKPGDQIILCSDGVWSMVEDETLGALAAQCQTPAELSSNLVQLALARQSDDNCSVVALRVQGFKALSVPEPQPERRRWLW